jgi:hypothetical protein
MDNRENEVIRPPSAPTTPDPLITRAQQIDSRTAVCFNGYYGEDFPLDDDGEIQCQSQVHSFGAKAQTASLIGL